MAPIGVLPKKFQTNATRGAGGGTGGGASVGSNGNYRPGAGVGGSASSLLQNSSRSSASSAMFGKRPGACLYGIGARRTKGSTGAIFDPYKFNNNSNLFALRSLNSRVDFMQPTYQDYGCQGNSCNNKPNAFEILNASMAMLTGLAGATKTVLDAVDAHKEKATGTDAMQGAGAANNTVDLNSLKAKNDAVKKVDEKIDNFATGFDRAVSAETSKLQANAGSATQIISSLQDITDSNGTKVFDATEIKGLQGIKDLEEIGKFTFEAPKIDGNSDLGDIDNAVVDINTEASTLDPYITNIDTAIETIKGKLNGLSAVNADNVSVVSVKTQLSQLLQQLENTKTNLTKTKEALSGQGKELEKLRGEKAKAMDALYDGVKKSMDTIKENAGKMDELKSKITSTAKKGDIKKIVKEYNNLAKNNKALLDAMKDSFTGNNNILRDSAGKEFSLHDCDEYSDYTLLLKLNKDTVDVDGNKNNAAALQKLLERVSGNNS